MRIFKTFSKLGKEGNFHNLIKGICTNLTINIENLFLAFGNMSKLTPNPMSKKSYIVHLGKGKKIDEK